ncbi:hypothetical protein DH2020_030057 [Rehmannia glutinosa]|uniref:RING-type E3 ubiquitin transferase n=1 Tax=Rehmannia glutinosa TaxID=99300 RepID=A0ABR0VR19_REHGL
MRLRTSVDEDEISIVLCSESFDVELEEIDHFDEWYLEDQTSYMLKEYWMTEDEIVKLVRGAYNFAKQHKPSMIGSSVISFVVGIDVCTVQQEGEELEAAMDRAIRAENLVPWNYIHLNYFDISRDMFLFLFNLPRIRVEDVNDGLGLMETCPICLHSLTISTQITHVPKCNHVFHTHCIAKWLLKNNSCPLCRLQVV